MEIKRSIEELVTEYLDIFPVVGILGSRQVGKTSLVKKIQKTRQAQYLDLESSEDRQKLSNPVLYFSNHSEKIIILDEIQLLPELFAELRGIVDQDRRPGRFIILGSASPTLIKKSADSLAGRIGYLEMTPFLLEEIGETHLTRLWNRGGFPLSYLSKSDQASLIWRKNFIRSYVERDLNLLGLNADSKVIERFWRMLASMHGNIWNAENMSRSMGLSSITVNKYLNFVEGAFLVLRLEPYFINTQKRLVKSPKIYLRDSGIVHAFNNISSAQLLLDDPGVGASWEGFVIEQIKMAVKDKARLFYYRTQQGAEADLILEKNNKVVAAIEIKLGTAPAISKGFRVVLEDTRAVHAFVIANVKESYQMDTNIQVTSLPFFLTEHLTKLLS